MSDFIYSRGGAETSLLQKELLRIYPDKSLQLKEFAGPWGSLVVSQNPYHGFQVYQSEEHIAVMIGGPVLQFQDNNFLIHGEESEGTRAVYERWLHNGINWEQDLSGPFCFFVIDKLESRLSLVTDLMSFVPVYQVIDQDDLMLSTHIDVLARCAGREDDLDRVSLADFILQGTMTYPFTAYENILQLAPGSVYHTSITSDHLERYSYYLPLEENMYQNMDKAVEDFRSGMESYIDSVVEGVDKAAIFLSGGEDSRSVAGLLAGKVKLDSHVFLDAMNREGKVAKRAAKKYRASFNLALRKKDHLLDVMESSTTLVGSGAEFLSVHTIGFHTSCGLTSYAAVFGGYFGDELFKGARIGKTTWSTKYAFLPQRKDPSISPGKPAINLVFTSEIMEEVKKRRTRHLERIRLMRPESAEEWYGVWPASMDQHISTIHGNRRLFRSYEPYTSHAAVKIAARIPQKWKLNRIFFQKAVKPYLAPAKFIQHGDGRFPYFSYKANLGLSFYTFVYRKIRRRIEGSSTTNNNPWSDWEAVLKTDRWREQVAKYGPGVELIAEVFQEKEVEEIMKHLGKFQKYHFLQVLYQVSLVSKQKVIQIQAV